MSIKSKLRTIWGSIIYHYFRHLYKKNPKLAADGVFKRAYHRPMDLDNPKHLIEKITWLQFNTDTSLWTLCADKLRVREYVEQCGLSDYMPKLYGHWESPEDVDVTNLPNQFVLKANNGCGSVMIVKDKNTLDIDAMKKTMKKWLSRPFGYVGAQTHYLRIKPCIIAEELLPITGEQAKWSPTSLIDYKFWCFSGVPESCFIAYNRGGFVKGGKLSIDLYDTKWSRLDDYVISNRHYKIIEEIKIPQPTCWEEMLQIAAKLSEPFPEVRVDLYNINGKPIIGELTFTSGYGYFTEEYYNYLGSKIDLEKLKK